MSTAASASACPRVTVDGNDFFAVYEAAGEVIRRAATAAARPYSNAKPTASTATFEGDAQTDRPAGEVENLRAHHDCLKTSASA